MSKINRVAYGIIIVWALVIALGHLWQEGREILICMNAKDFYQSHHKIPSLRAMQAPTTTFAGEPYDWQCDYGNAGLANCTLLWTKQQDKGAKSTRYVRSCGNLNEAMRFMDFF